VEGVGGEKRGGGGGGGGGGGVEEKRRDRDRRSFIAEIEIKIEMFYNVN